MSTRTEVPKVEAIGYQYYRISFTVVLCVLPYMFLKHVIIGLVVYVLYIALTFLFERFLAERVDGRDRGVFITGCDTGLGHMCAEYLDHHGFTVFAGCLDENSPGARKLKKDSSKFLHILEVNVIQDASVANALEYIKKNLPKKGLWSVVNNAGINLIGEVELSTISIYQKGMAVNFYGPVRVMQAFLPLIRQSKGRVVNVTSVHALLAQPQWSIYEATKHGLETVSDSLRMEMAKFGVKVSLVEPGMFGGFTAIHHETMVDREKADALDMWKQASEEVQRTYSKQYVLSWIPPPIPPIRNVDPNGVSRAIEHALCSGRPRARYLVQGVGTKALARLYRQLPTWLVDWYVLNFKSF